MKHAHAPLWTLVFIASAMITLAPNPAYADAVGPYYATPSWDQTLPSSTRFIVLSNMSSAAVLDRETGLVWQRTPSHSSMSFYTAQQICEIATTGGRQGWRLPSIHELQSLIDPTVFSVLPAPPIVSLPSGNPFIGVNIFNYWTGTTVASDATLAYFLSILAGAGPGIADKTDSSNVTQVWCVRGGGPISVY